MNQHIQTLVNYAKFVRYENKPPQHHSNGCHWFAGHKTNEKASHSACPICEAIAALDKQEVAPNDR